MFSIEEHIFIHIRYSRTNCVVNYIILECMYWASLCLNTDTNCHAPFHLQAYMHAFINYSLKIIVQMWLADISSHFQGIFQKNLCSPEYKLSIVGIAFDPKSAMDRFDQVLLMFVAAVQLLEPV